jgi:hypothetical protein
VGVGELLTIGFGDLRSGLQGVAISGAGSLLARGRSVEAASAPEIVALADGGWQVSAGEAFTITLTALGDPAPLCERGQSSICAVRGTIGGESIDGLGALTRSEHPATAALERAISIWFDPGPRVALAAQRPAAAGGHGDERLEAIVFAGEAPHTAARVDDPRLSTTYDGAGRVTHCGLELWEGAESERALRIGGEALAHGEIALPGGGRARVAFLGAHSEGHQGLGRYDITER